MPDSTIITNQTPKEKPVVITSEGSKKNMFKFSFVNPKILGAMTVLLLLIGGVGAGVYLTQVRQQATTQATLSGVDLTFKPAELQVAADSEFSVDIFISSKDSQITSTDLTVKYDPQLLTLSSVTPKQFLPKILIQPYIGAGSASVSLGTDGNSGVSGSGVIASLVFKVNSQNETSSGQISFDPVHTKINVLNRSDDANDSLGSAKITVGPAASPGADHSASSNPAPSENPSASPAQSPSNESSISPDFNGDGRTNSIDLSIMYSGWGSPKTDIQKKADLNNDGVVNGIDYAIFLPKFKP